MTDPAAQLPEAGIVRVSGPQQAGTGFVVSPRGRILTCAHVLAGCAVGDTVTVEPRAGQLRLDAVVEVLQDPPDLAILRLTASLPPEVAVLPLGESSQLTGRRLRTAGYPRLRPTEGLPGELQYYGETSRAGYRQLALRSDEATLGFSGAPIWDPEQEAVAGMVLSVATGDPAERLRNTSLGLPAETLRKLCRDPDLQLPRNHPYRALEPLEVCFVSSEYPPRMFGGLGAHVEQLTAALGQRVDVLNLDVVLPSSGPGMDDYQNAPAGIQLRPLAGRSGPDNPSYEIPVSWVTFANGAADKIDGLIAGGASVDVLHCHDWVTVLAGLRCRWRHKIPLVFHVHLPNRAPLAASVENLGLTCADVVTVNSEAMRDELLVRTRKLRLAPRPIRVIRNGVDLDVFTPRADWPVDDGYVLFVGRIVKQKGVEYLLRAFYYILRAFPDVRLKVVGNGDLLPQLRRLSANLMLSDRQVEFVKPTPWLTRPEMAALYQGARVVVQPSIYEPFGMTALEALACQRPVVASRIGGLREIVQHNVNGFLAEPEDELDLAQWVMTLLADADLRERLGREGRARVGGGYGWGQIAEQFVGVYRDVRTGGDTPAPPGAELFVQQIRKTATRVDSSMYGELYSLFDGMPGYS
jgi:glycogen(starch) synthase